MSKKATKGKTAQELKEAGQKLALEHSGLPWLDQAMKALRLYCNLLKRRAYRGEDSPEFTMEEFRVYVIEGKMLPEPKSLNAWGALPRVAVAEGLIEFTGEVTNAFRPKSHGRLVKVWRPC